MVVCLGGGRDSAWFRARRGSCTVRARFRGSCPIGFLGRSTSLGRVISFAPLGLGRARADANPRLAPWAILLRHSVARWAAGMPRNSVENQTFYGGRCVGSAMMILSWRLVDGVGCEAVPSAGDTGADR